MMEMWKTGIYEICTIDIEDLHQDDIDAVDWASVKVGDEILGGVLKHIDPETKAYFTVAAKQYKHKDTGEIWTKDEIIDSCKQFFGESEEHSKYGSLEEYIDHVMESFEEVGKEN